MKAFEVTAPGVGSVVDVDPPVAGAGQVVVDVARVGICGTDIGMFNSAGRWPRKYPMRLGHEWCGTVSEVGSDVDPAWVGRRVTGDTMLGCQKCRLCETNRHYVCRERHEIGVRDWPGALAERLLVPEWALYRLPDVVTDEMGAMVEPGGNAYRTVAASDAAEGVRVLVLGPGTIGLLATAFALAAGAEVHVLGVTPQSLALARKTGAHGVWTQDELPDLPWDAIINATTDGAMPAFAINNVEPGGRVVLIGGGREPTEINPQILVGKSITVTGILGGSHGLQPAIDGYENGTVDPRPLIADTIGLADVADVLTRKVQSSTGPKFLVDPRS